MAEYIGLQPVIKEYVGLQQILTDYFGGAAGGEIGYDIILLAGQSNMAGRGVYSAGVDTTDANVFQFDGYAASGTYRTIISGIDPLKQPEGAVLPTGVGPGMFFAKAYAAATGRKVLLVPAAWGGTALVAGVLTWSPYGANNRDYLNAIDQANRAVTAAVAAISGSRFAGTLWIQGEGDGSNSVTRAAYLSALKDLVAGFRAGIAGATDSFFIVGQMMPEAIAAQAGTYSEIDAAHKEFVATGAKTAFAVIGSGYNKGDNLHYNEAGARLMGSTMGGLVTLASGRTTSSAVPSQVTGLSAGSISSTSVPLTWGAPYSGGVVTDYLVEYKKTSDVGWSTFSDGTNVLSSASVSGLLPSTSYDFRVTATNAAGAGTPSSVLTVSTAAGVTTSNVRLASLTAIIETGDGTAGWNYGSTTGATFAASHAGVSDKKLPAGVDGYIQWTLSSTYSAGRSWMLGVTDSQTDPVYSAGATGYKFGVLNNSAGYYKLIVNGATVTVAPTVQITPQTGDIMRLRRASGVWVAEIATAAAPTTFTVIYTFATADNADVWFGVSSNNSFGVNVVNGPLVGANVI